MVWRSPSETGVQLWSYHLLSNGVAGALGVGDLEPRSELIERMQDYAHGARRLDRSCYHYYRSWHAMLRGDLDAALARAAQRRCPWPRRPAARSTWCCAGSRWRRCCWPAVTSSVRTAEMRQVRPAARAINNRLLEYMTMLAYADVALAGGRRRVALVALRRGFQVGREHGFRHFLWWLPESMSRVAAVALHEGIESELRSMADPHRAACDLRHGDRPVAGGPGRSSCRHWAASAWARTAPPDQPGFRASPWGCCKLPGGTRWKGGRDHHRGLALAAHRCRLRAAIPDHHAAPSAQAARRGRAPWCCATAG